MIKKFNEFINEGMMSKMWRELDGTEERKEEVELLNVDGVEERHSFTDNNGVFHKNGYKVKDKEIYKNDVLYTLICRLISTRGNECSLNDIDISNIEDLNSTFYISNFNGDISGWDVSNVTNFSGLFLSSGFDGKNCDLSKWKICTDENKEVDMSEMFSECEFNGDISKWDTSRVKNMSKMFEGSKFNNNLSDWNVSNCTDFSQMFFESEFTGENGNIGKWIFYKGNKAIKFNYMFYKTEIKCNLSKWEIDRNQYVTRDFMFSQCTIKEEYKPKFAR